MKTIAVLNQKGGVGKTTTVTNTAAGMAAAGCRVLVIDFDPQAHLTIHLGIEPTDVEKGGYSVLTQNASVAEEAIQARENLWVLPASIDLVGAESELVSVVGREIILREALEAVEEVFDYCFIDCAPSLGLLTVNALAAAQEVLIPLQPHFLALQGFGKLLQTVELVNKRINPNLRVRGILLCMYDGRASLPKEVKADIEAFLENARGSGSAWADAEILPVVIRRNIKLAEAPSYGKSIFEYEGECNGSKDYLEVARFFLEADGRSAEGILEVLAPQEVEEEAVQAVAEAEPTQEIDIDPTIVEEVPSHQEAPPPMSSSQEEPQGAPAPDPNPPIEIVEIPPVPQPTQPEHNPVAETEKQPERQPWPDMSPPIDFNSAV